MQFDVLQLDLDLQMISEHLADLWGIIASFSAPSSLLPLQTVVN